MTTKRTFPGAGCPCIVFAGSFISNNEREEPMKVEYRYSKRYTPFRAIVGELFSLAPEDRGLLYAALKYRRGWRAFSSVRDRSTEESLKKTPRAPLVAFEFSVLIAREISSTWVNLFFHSPSLREIRHIATLRSNCKIKRGCFSLRRFELLLCRFSLRIFWRFFSLYNKPNTHPSSLCTIFASSKKLRFHLDLKDLSILLKQKCDLTLSLFWIVQSAIFQAASRVAVIRRT